VVRMEKVITVKEGDDRIQVDLALPAQRFAGRVVRADTGEGVARVHVYLEDPYSTQRLSAGEARTNDAGDFDMIASESGTYPVAIRYGGGDGSGRWIMAEPMTVTIPEGGEVTGKVIRIGPGATLRGCVRDSAGGPISDVSLKFLSEAELTAAPSLPFQAWARRGPLLLSHYPDQMRGWKGSSDNEGCFVIDGIAKGRGLLYASHRDHAPAWIPGIWIGEGETTRDLVLTRGGSLEIRFPAGALDAGTDLQVSLARPGLPKPIVIGRKTMHGPYLREISSEAWLLPHLPPGTWTVEGRIEERSLREVVEVREGERAAADLSETVGP
jgi:hypothetical protein